jgi:hypothetical protein
VGNAWRGRSFAIQFHRCGMLEGLDGRHDDRSHESREGRRPGFPGWFRIWGGSGSFDHFCCSAAACRGRFVYAPCFGRRDMDGSGRSVLKQRAAPSERGGGFGGRLGLDEPGKCKLLILILVFLAVRLRTELGATAQTLEKREFLPAEKTLHTSFRSSQWAGGLRAHLEVSLR